MNLRFIGSRHFSEDKNSKDNIAEEINPDIKNSAQKDNTNSSKEASNNGDLNQTAEKFDDLFHKYRETNEDFKAILVYMKRLFPPEAEHISQVFDKSANKNTRNVASKVLRSYLIFLAFAFPLGLMIFPRIFGGDLKNDESRLKRLMARMGIIEAKMFDGRVIKVGESKIDSINSNDIYDQ
ncbi:hypothetical protein ROZALSC1DRAFT_30266 [Rozella allomycis CSF55]|uniref:Uncharacterized protein n=1 Tax=Rozella allomycis (strain CSF55) TaxID=988480 RepID=A0A4P9YFE2_ROZAC|nr:hypothetical protein ROZALSC1DRAFT_30266 [Rozella allomycis CSF55]